MRARVLVTASGSIIGEGIIKCLILANKSSNGPVSYEIIASDMSPLAPGLYRGDRGELLPSADSPEYIDAIIRVCKNLKVQAIFVGSDEELVPLARGRERIESETSARLITNSLQVLMIGIDKWKTYQFLKSNGISHAESALPDQRDGFIQVTGFPIIVKPREGHGSSNLFIANSETEVDNAIASIKRNRGQPILQEYLKAEDAEFTTGITVDGSGEKVISSIAIRRILKHGQTYKAFVDHFDSVRKSAEASALALRCTGPVNVQARVIDGATKIFEINPRFSASCPIRAVAGVNEPDIVFRNQILNEDLEVSSYRKLVCLRYWNELYLPYETYGEALQYGKVKGEESFIPDYF